MQWVCSVCGYIHNDGEPPDFCYDCGAPGSNFTEWIDDDEDEIHDAIDEDFDDDIDLDIDDTPNDEDNNKDNDDGDMN